MSKVSVIIPVYNTEKFLRKCLDSVCNQTLQDIEIICINDCSTDGSLEILREYARKDNRIKLIELLENCGAAKARNIGIDIAEGEYLGFIDSDDYIDLDFYENLYAKAIETSADVVKGSDMLIIWQNGRKEIDKQNEKIKKNKINFWSQYTTAIYKRVFILENNIEFPAGLLVGEDPVFAIKCAFLSNKIDIINNAQYYYMRREGSLNSDIWDDEKLDSYIKYINTFIKISKDFKLDVSSYKLFYTRLLEDVYWTRKRKTISYCKRYKKLTKLLKKVRKNSVKDKINILFDASVLMDGCIDKNAQRGIFWVTYNLARQFVKDSRFELTFILETSVNNKIPKELPIFKDVKIMSKNFYLGAGANYKVIPNKKFNIYKYDVYFNSGHTSNFNTDFKPIRFYYLHDVMPMLKYDWFDNKWKKYFLDFHQSLNSDDYAFCVSQDCKKGFLRFFDKLEPENLFVSYNSTSQKLIVNKDKAQLDIILKKYNVHRSKNDKYIYYMGSVDDSRKNLIFTIKCFIKFIEQYNINDLYFYLGGAGKEKLEANLTKMLGQLYVNYSNFIKPLGFVSANDVNILYSNSLFFSFLSLYEGFGMPPLEAMQAGTPVVCANNSSLPEVVGDAAILVDGDDEKQIINAFRDFYFNEDLRNEYIQKGLERAKLFSWEKTYKIISDKIIDVLSENIIKN